MRLYGAGVAVGATVMLAGYAFGLPIIMLFGWLILMVLANLITRWRE